MKYQTHSETSYAAAVDILESADTLRAKVYRFIASNDQGVIDEEMQTFLQMNPSTQRPRRVELVELGVVIDSGCRRKTRSGRMAVVWVAKRRQQEQKQGELF